MVLRANGLLLASVLAGVPAAAATVSIDFVGGSNVEIVSATQNNPGGGWVEPSGVWQENGLRVAWSLMDYCDISVPAGFTGFTFLSNENAGACTGAARQLTVTRADGGAFSLLGVGTLATYEGYTARASFLPEGGGSGAATYHEVPVLQESLSFSGVRWTGGTASGTAGTTSPETWDPEETVFDVPPLGFGPSAAEFAPGTLEALTGLRSLTITAGLTFPGYEAIHPAAEAALRSLGSAPAPILQGLDACGFVESCVLPGLGEFGFSIGEGGRNDRKVVALSGLTLDLDPPLGAPLPATFWLMLGGLAPLLWRCARRSRAA